MLVGRIAGATRVLGAPVDWDKSEQGACCGLPIRDDSTSAGPGMTSAWQPTPDELQRLNAGASIHLTILGRGHPPVSMTVGAVPEGERVEPARLAKRPVAFRVVSKLRTWIYYDHEADAAAAAEKLNTSYQGLYVRDGT